MKAKTMKQNSKNIQLVAKVEALDDLILQIDTDENHPALNTIKEARAACVEALGFDPAEEPNRAYIIANGLAPEGIQLNNMSDLPLWAVDVPGNLHFVLANAETAADAVEAVGAELVEPEGEYRAFRIISAVVHEDSAYTVTLDKDGAVAD